MTQVRIATISHYTELLKSLGHNPADVLSRNNYSPDFFASSVIDRRINYAEVEHLLQIAANASGCEYFGALLGSRQSIHFLGPLALVLVNAQTLGQALEHLEQLFAYHVQQGSVVSICNYGKQAALTYTVTIDLAAIRQTNELAMAEGLIAIKALCGSSWKPNRVNFTHKPPRQLKPYNKIFGAPVYFNQEKTEIVFSSDDLNRPIANADSYIKNVLRQQLEQHNKLAPNDTQAKIESTIRLCMLDGNCSIEQVAKKVRMHKRTLQRTLQEESTSFTQIIDNVRKNLATERLRHSDMSMVQIANLLGYADSSTFNRAFKRWYGITPNLWRDREIAALK